MKQKKKKLKKKNHLLRSKVYKTAGMTTIGTTTLGGFVAYGAITDWQSFQNELNNFIVVQEESLKLNMAIAIPMLIGILVFLWVAKKKNKEFFKDKISMDIFTVIVICYIVYSIIEVALASLVGAFIGSVIDEFGFSIAAKSNKLKAEEEHDMDLEYERETRRIKARNKAREDLNGSV